jgi:hypothetical protein
MKNPFEKVQLTRKKHDGTVECLIQFGTEPAAWIPLPTIVAIYDDTCETGTFTSSNGLNLL